MAKGLPVPPVPDDPERYRSPFDELIGARWEEFSGERVVAVVPVRQELHQPAGMVHGGVYAAVVESSASLGATLWLAGEGSAVGVANHTDFLRPVRDGELRFVATPLHRGRSSQLWQVDVADADGRRVAHGRVSLRNLRGQAPA